MNYSLHTLIACSTPFSANALSAYTIDINNDKKIAFGDYIKAGARTANWNIAYRDFWIANPLHQQNTSEICF